MRPPTATRMRDLPRAPLVVLGVLSIVAFGGWLYGYGVLLEPIVVDTGWRESTLSGVYGASLLLTGVGGALAGRLLDGIGSRRLFLASAVLAPALLLVAAGAQDVAVFAVSATLGGAVTGAIGYYHATSTVIARLVPEARAEAITGLTLFGAFASPVALPLLGLAVERLGWRPTLRLTAVAIGLALLTAGLLRDVHPPASAPPSFRRAAAEVRARPRLRALFLGTTLVGATSAVIILQQVPAMVGAGFALTTASTLAGARGAAQLGGRLPLPALLRRVPAGRLLAWSYALCGIGALLLLSPGTLLLAGAFVVVAGVAIGALSALEGIHAAEVVDDEVLGTTLGLHTLVRGLGSAVGPVVAGVLLEVLGGRAPALLLAAAAGLAAAVVVARAEP